MSIRFDRGFLAAFAALPLALASLTPSEAEACGCLSPPVPEGIDDFAVNQQAEEIIFEVGTDSVTAHVLIRYAGSPEEFAWLVPVPNIPDLALSETMAFPLVAQASAPEVTTNPEWICPDPEYVCRYHDVPYCGDDEADSNSGALTSGTAGGTDGGGDPGGDDPGGVDVHKMEVIGSYETVVFSADDAQLAVDWLNDNGFIVNATMTPYMQPYIDKQMVFVAAKLVAGAGIDEIRPLKMTYAGTQPMIPLQLTAVASEPHLTVSAFIYADEPFRPEGHPSVGVDETAIATDQLGRGNYPMVLARTVDDAGGDAFVPEYLGTPPVPNFGGGSGCCDSPDDWCFAGGDGQCQCPRDEWDADDCASIEGLDEGIALVDMLAEQYSFMTRLTTRMSPEEMTFDPMFQRGAPSDAPSGRLVLRGSQYTLQGCEADILDPDAYDEVQQRIDCSAIYCGEGSCVVTDQGAGCDCNAGFAARVFTDLDGEASVTCVPTEHTVDLGMNLDLPDICAGIDCGAGSCLDIGGFPSCQCDSGNAAVVSGDSPIPLCGTITQVTATPGAGNYSGALQDVPVCAPTPQNCGEHGWLVANDDKRIQGVVCESSEPDPSALVAPPKPTCEDGGSASCSCSVDNPVDLGWMLGAVGLMGIRLRRRR